MDWEEKQGFWINSPPVAPFAYYHRANVPGQERRAFIFCPPFAEEKNKSQRVLVETARALAGLGVDVLRLDYCGTGDSQGNLTDVSIDNWKENIITAIDFCRDNGAKRIGLLGLRLGSLLAATVADRYSGIEWLVHLTPVIDSKKYLNNVLRSKLIKEMLTKGRIDSREKIEGNAQSPMDYDGFLISPRLYSELQNLQLPGRFLHSGGKVLIVHASLNPKIGADTLSLADKYQNSGTDITLQSVHAEPFWNVHGIPSFEKIVRCITDWFKTYSDGNPVRVTENNKSGTAIQIARRIQMNYGYEESTAIETPYGFLSGIFHVPHSWQENIGTAIVFLHGWAGYRIGPHRMLVNAARKFCSEGYLCFRADMRGRGSSSGAITDTAIPTIQEDGRYAIKEIRERFSPRKVIVLGQCQGGTASFTIDHIEGSIIWSAPPLIHTPLANLRRTWFMAKSYLRKALAKQTWQKLAKGEINYRLIGEAMFGHFRSQRDDDKYDVVGASSGETAGGARKGRPCLFVYGENDPDTRYASRTYKTLCRQAGMVPKFHIVEGANHSFYSVKWEQEVIDVTLGWLKECFPLIPREEQKTSPRINA